VEFIRWFSDIRLGDVPLVGGKNASLVLRTIRAVLDAETRLRADGSAVAGRSAAVQPAEVASVRR
jgi:hypothetical protein